MLKADGERRLRDHDMERVRLYEAVRLSAFAYHAPKKLPKFKAAGEAAKPKRRAEPENSEWARAQVSAFFAGFRASGRGH